MARFSTKLRSGLISLIYYRTLNIHPEDADLGAGTVLMNVDVEKAILGSTFLHEFWTSMISCSIALYVLYTHLGVAFVVPTVSSIVMAVICYQVGKAMKPRQLQWAAATQNRVTAISYATGCMKAVRILGLTGTVHDDLTRLRSEEVNKQKSVNLSYPDPKVLSSTGLFVVCSQLFSYSVSLTESAFLINYNPST